MSNNTSPYDFSMDLKPGKPVADQSPKDRWIAPPFRAHQINSEAALVSLHGQYPGKLLNLQLLQILHLCDRFRTVEQHKRHVLETMNWAPDVGVAVKEAIEHLIEQKLLYTQEQVLDQWVSASSHKATTPKLAHCFIRTANRANALERLLGSLATHVDGSELNLWVLDDSKDEQSAQANESVFQAFKDKWPAPSHYVNRTRTHELIRKIANGSGASVESLSWVLEGDPNNQALTYGTAFNLALLLSAGQRFIILDDDTTLETFLFEEAHMGVQVSPNLKRRIRFLSTQTPENAQFPQAKVDILAEHAAWLGRSIGEVSLDLAPRHPDFLSDVDAMILHRITRQSRIRFTINGLLGDSGTDSANWLFTQRPEDISALCHADPETKNKLLHRRFAYASLGTQVTVDTTFMSSIRGIDNREMVLPTLPQGRGEDLFFGSITQFLYPGALTASLPFMSPHRPGEERRWSEEDIGFSPALNKRTNGITVLSDWIDALNLPEGDVMTRLNYLRGWLAHIAQLDDTEMSELLLEYLNETQGEFLKALNDTASALEAPEWLQALYAKITQDSLAEDPDHEAHLLILSRPIQQLAKQYGNVMSDWVLAWRWCCQHEMANELP